MPVDISAAVQHLLKRFEPLRSGGLIKALAIDTTADALLSIRLPGAYREFSGAGAQIGCRYGKPTGERIPAMCFRLLGHPADIRRFMGAAQAAGRLLKGKLSQCHLVKAKDVQGSNGKAEQCTWLISIFDAARRKQPLTDGLAGGDWFLWSKEENVVVAEQTVARYRGDRPVAVKARASVKELAQSTDDTQAFAVLDDVVETSIALLQWVGEQSEESPEEDGAQKNLSTCEMLEMLWATDRGREEVIDLASQSLMALARRLGKKSAGSICRCDIYNNEIKEELDKIKAREALERSRRSMAGKDHPDN